MATDLRPPQERQPLPTNAPSASTVSQDQSRIEALERLRAHLQRIDLEDREPPCECIQTEVDLFDARSCDFHNPNSWWNVALRAVTPAERYEDYEPVTAQDCPF